MIKVLHKAWGMMELVVATSPAPVTLARLAAECGINKATCSRIVRELVDADYLEQVSRQAGYVPGPAAWTMARRTVFAPELTGAATAAVARCATQLGESVLFAVRRGRWRYVLAHDNANPDLRIALDKIRYDDLWETATGLVMAAHARPEELARLMGRKGIPSSPLYRAKTRQELLALLSAIRRDGRFAAVRPDHPVSITAVPVLRGAEVVGALGLSCPAVSFKGQRRQRLLAGLAAAATDLSRKISIPHTPG